MIELNLQIGLLLLAAAGIGVVAGWFIGSAITNRRLNELGDDWQIKFDETVRQRDRFNSENTKLRASVEAQQSVVHKHEIAATRVKTELESANEKLKLQAKDLFNLGNARDALKNEVDESRSTLNRAKQQVTALETEFVKAGDFYKGELGKALEKRRALETKIDDSGLELDSMRNLLESSSSEKDSLNKMLNSANTRLENLDIIESRVIELEAENAQLRHDASRTRQDAEALRRDAAELEELKVQNKELAHCLKSMENSRKQYEDDAKRYRDQVGQSEQLSETLRIKLDDVEKNLLEMAQQNDDAQKIARQQQKQRQTNGHAKPAQEIDDLTEIVGIGKVFQRTLHDLGIFNYRQIASFGPSDIARVNMALKENRGRMEQDDWIGQAKELHYKKYGAAEQH